MWHITGTMNTNNLNLIWREGRDRAVAGGVTADCPYTDTVRKRAWILGFSAGLEIVRGKLPR